MKKILLLFVLSIIYTFTCFAQGSNGLIAHWDFNGTTNDVSGNGLNGVVTGATYAPGYSGVPNTALYFNGFNAITSQYDNVSVAYSPTMNVTNYSICAMIKALGFSSDRCQGNTILWHGVQLNSDFYSMYFNDNSYDQNCDAYNPSYNNFHVSANDFDTYQGTSWLDTNFIQINRWYCVVGTYDQNNFKLYIDGNLVKTIPWNQPIGSSTNGISIGLANPSPSYPYPFTGIIDDIRLYNRALSANEAQEYCDSVRMPPAQVPIVSASVQVQISPNPAHSYISVSIPNSISKGTMQLINAVGQIVLQTSINNNKTTIDISSLPNGIYMGRMMIDNQVVVKKIIKE